MTIENFGSLKRQSKQQVLRSAQDDNHKEASASLTVTQYSEVMTSVMG